VNTRMCAVFTCAAFLAGAICGRFTLEAQSPQRSPLPQEHVTGIGGVFFKAKDPTALAEWYRVNLGLDIAGTRTVFEWRERTDQARDALTVWALFSESTPYFSPGTAPFMVNYRVRNLDRMVAQLRARGVVVDSRIVEEAAGRFTWVVDPEGHRIELWEPRY
jgi:predicted enzyme related to lactoylglutathione lyase